MTLTDCTIHGNTGADGGGLRTDNYDGDLANLTVTDSSITGNTAAHSGGGLENYATATLTGCTISGNSASGVQRQHGQLRCGEGDRRHHQRKLFR